MNDINFFSSFDKYKKSQKKKPAIIAGAILGGILVIALFYGFLGFRILYLNRQIKADNAYLNSPQVKTKLTQIRAQKDAALSLKKYDAETGMILQKIAGSDMVNSKFLDALQKAFPSTVSLKGLSLQGTLLNLQGTAPNLDSVAELTHNLEDSGLFSRVQAGSITQNQDGDAFLFAVVCNLKGAAGQ